MIHLKSNEEIKIMQLGGRILSEALYQTLRSIKPGISERQLDSLAEKFIREKGGKPGFMRVKGYHHATCFSTNDVIVHGIPGDYKLKEDDVIGIDCGVFYQGFHTDMSETVRLKNGKPRFYTGDESDGDEVDKFLSTGKKALQQAIKRSLIGNRVGHISKTIQDIVEREEGYSIVRSLIGHGVGRQLHEEPEIPGFLYTDINNTPLLKKNMTIAVEIIYNQGTYETVIDKDGWTIRTKDHSIAGLFERTIAIADHSPRLLTEFSN
jgi:methionyl aminopeptidase